MKEVRWSEVNLSKIVDYWMDQYETTDGKKITCIRHSVDASRGTVLFVFDVEDENE